MLVRSMILRLGKADRTSSTIGPEKDSADTVVRIVETAKAFAALATIATLLRSVTPSTDAVANAICGW